MTQFFNIVMEKFFALTLGTVLLAIIVICLQITANFVETIPEKTISLGWMMVTIWVGLITLLTLIQISKNPENND